VKKDRNPGALKDENNRQSWGHDHGQESSRCPCLVP
jgi:hypothetical protein